MNQMYGKAREIATESGLGWVSGTIKAILVDLGAYTLSIDSDEFLSSIPTGARIGSPVTLASKTNALGVCDAADISFTGILDAPTIEAIVLYRDTGSASTSRLIAYLDTATGLPTAAGATQVDVAWSNGSNRIFKI